MTDAAHASGRAAGLGYRRIAGSNPAPATNHRENDS